jgi:hypothetical protein
MIAIKKMNLKCQCMMKLANIVSTISTISTIKVRVFYLYEGSDNTHKYVHKKITTPFLN